MRRPERNALVVVVLVLGAAGFLPLFGGPGYEATIAAGIVVPSAAAIATALSVLAAEDAPFAAFVRGIVVGGGLGVVALAVAFVHGFRVGFCDPSEGAWLFVIGPGVGAVLGGVWGSAVGVLMGAWKARGARRPRAVAVTAAVALPVLGIVVSVGRFYTSPMVFAFDPFVGFFAGTLYDSVITGVSRLETYRLGSLATLLSAGAFAFAVERRASGALTLAWSRHPGAVVLGLCAASASLYHVDRGPSLGHYQTARTIREALGATLTGKRCELVFPKGTPDVEARALLGECDGHVAQLERFFGTKGPDRITAFVFASADQKGYLMGAAGTYIAKPWRHEIYVQRAGFPHPVMRHELAHVVAGSFGVGPFRVAGPLSGLIPDPGRIEGVAVAASPHDEELSLGEWVRAMKDLGLLPPLERVFKLSFLGEPSSRAYVVAGAFIEWLGRTHGMDVVRRWYSGASLEGASGKTLAELEAAWLASIDALEVSPDVLEVARARFDQPAIFGRRCPHVVDRIAGDAAGALGQQDTERARKLYHDVLALDPHDFNARFALSTCAAREGKLDETRGVLRALSEDTTLGKAIRARTVESLGDLALQTGHAEEARARFDEVRRLVVDLDRLRTLDVKTYAASGPGRDAIVQYLLGDPEKGRDTPQASAALGAWAEREPTQGMADYLLARTYFTEARYDLAARSLDAALGKRLPIPSVEREAYRLRVVLACALGDARTLEVASARWLTLPSPRAPEREDMTELVERCSGSVSTTATAMGTPPAAAPASATASPPASGSAPASVSGTAPASASAPSTVCPPSMLRIGGGPASIGSRRGDGAEDEWPRYGTKLATFCLDRTEVTVGAYATCVASGKCTEAGSYHVTCTAKGHADDYPINCVDHAQATAFCAAEGARLPTEAEWEYAASGGDERAFSFGNESPDGRACWKTNGACKVGSFPPGAFGLVDMTGNVWEWTSSAYGDYPYALDGAPNRVYRGGSWSRRFEKWMRVRLRNRAPPSFEGSHLGFRCAMTPAGTECPFGTGDDGACLEGVVGAECRPGKTWNGVRCSADGEPGCGEAHHLVPGRGCQFDVAVPIESTGPPDLAAVRRTRSPEFDADCGKFQPTRPLAFKLEDGTHEARNAVGRSLGCKNRDVGVGWNSACCPR